jgi:tetratricopeptide (TPR) repeat protein
VLQSLVDKSLIRFADGRFWMLETIREFALERLEETGGAEELRHRHSAYFLELGELAKPELVGRSSSIWFDRLEAEHDNIRAVLGDALQHGRADVALRIGGAVSGFWFTRGYWSEGRRWFEAALAAGTDSDPQLRADALGGAGLLAVWQGDVERGRAAADELLALAAETDSARARADGLLLAGIVAERRGDWDDAAQLFAETTELARELGDSRLLSIAVNNLGNVALQRDEYERALGPFEESLAIGWELDDQDILARAFSNLGVTTLMLGDVQRARSLLRDALVAAREIGHMEGFMYGLVGLGAAYVREDPARAARLLGHADMLCEEAALALEQFEGRFRDEAEAELRARLGEDAYAAVYAEGRALALEDALALALRPD